MRNLSLVISSLLHEVLLLIYWFFYCYYIYTLGFGIRFEIFLLVASEHLLANKKDMDNCSEVRIPALVWLDSPLPNTFNFWRVAKRAARATLPLLEKNDQTWEIRTVKGKKRYYHDLPLTPARPTALVTRVQ